MVFWCLMTHVLLDLFTAWGTQIFWPNDTKVALKTIFVVDPLYTFPLLLALILAFKKSDFQVRNKIIWKGIVISSIYLMLTCCLKIFAVHKFETALQLNKIRYSELIVKPTAFNTILWNANVSTKEGFLLADYSLFDSKPISFKEYKKDVSAEEKLAGNKDFETLAKMSEGWYLITQKNNNFYFNDLRFGLLDDDPNHPQFAFSYVFVEENGMLKAREVPKKSRQGVKLLKNLLARIKGN